ncbi:MAG: hypothetical protein WCT42_00825 [Candidatus Paceibacterota bacterium]|jgi:hypothetical protein
MDDERNKGKEDNKTKLDSLFSLLSKKNSIIKKYRKKFEDLKIGQIRNGIDGNNYKNE